ncbi:MAG: hypothetical protein R3B90_04630 [Planctomycetaceae bacterium]
MNIYRIHAETNLPSPPVVGGGAQRATNAAAPAAGPSPVKSDAATRRLLGALDATPDVRPDVVSAARAAIADGSLLSRQAAEESAHAFLNPLTTR